MRTRNSHDGRRVHFAPKLVQDSPTCKHQPKVDSIHFGAFTVPLHVTVNSVFYRLKKDLGGNTANASDPPSSACSSPVFQNSNFQSSKVINVEDFYAKCLVSGHWASRCPSQWRCWACFNYGHKARWCLTRSKPNLFWAPKTK